MKPADTAKKKIRKRCKSLHKQKPEEEPKFSRQLLEAAIKQLTGN
jgi:hypothetical protein